MPPDAPQGVCPQCLLAMGLNSSSGRFPQLEILELVGKGGMGAVYQARQPRLDRVVALKILPSEAEADPTFAERFTREARALARLNHPNIVSVFDFGDADGLFYFIMEFVDGANLRQTIEAGGLQPQEALEVVPQICDALQYAHDEGIVHRDIKPENILIDKKGRMKIADFGLAKLLRQEPADFTLTGTHQVMGTLHYMAPEQMEHPLSVDHRADIYSLGVVFYEILTGELPIGRFAPPSQKVQMDVRLDEVVMRSLEKEPQRRYQHVSEVKSDMQAITSSAFKAPLPDGNAAAAVRSRLKAPAIGLLVAGIVNCLTMLLVVAIPAALTIAGSSGMPGTMELAVLSVALLVGVLQIAGAVKMFDLSSYGLAVTACVLGLLPCTLGFLISLPFAIWDLVVLLQLQTQVAFAGPQAAGGPVDLPASADAGISPTVAQDSQELIPRYSRKAILGAGWVPFFFITLLLSVIVAPVEGGPDGPVEPELQWYHWVARLVLLPLGVTAPFGTTILGLIAISNTG